MTIICRVQSSIHGTADLHLVAFTKAIKGKEHSDKL